MPDTRILTVAAVIASLASTPAATAQSPLPVSPGSAAGVTTVAERCPTFSWGMLEDVAEYELLIYRLASAGRSAASEDLQTAMHTILPGSATSWTPPVDGCLVPGGRYAWALRAIREGGESEWSEARLFDVTAGPLIWEVEEALAVLQRYLAASGDLATKPEGRTDRTEGRAAVSLDGSAAVERPAGAPAARRGGTSTVLTGRGVALPSSPVGSEPPPRTVTSPGSYDLSLSGDLSLGGAVFKTGYPFLHNDGGYGFGNTGVGINALISSTPGVPGYPNGKQNTALGENSLRDNTTGFLNTAIGAKALLLTTSGHSNTGIGRSALALNQTGSRNTAAGAGALFSNTASDNTASGANALRANTLGSDNTAVGSGALYSNTKGINNVAAGANALRSNQGSLNSAFGTDTLYSNSVGSGNTAVGWRSLWSNMDGDGNTAVGREALFYSLAGDFNTAVGDFALFRTTGQYNTAIGDQAGLYNTTGSDNIFIANLGEAGDDATLRIGDGLSRTFISGIRSVTTGNMNAVTVVIDTDGQLGTASSSRRFKEEIRDMGDASSGLLDLRPVTFRYRQKALDGEQPLTYGLIAEEVLEVFPELVAFDAEGRPETVIYRLLTPMLVNELQKQARENRDQAEEIRRLRQLVLGLGSSRAAEADDEVVDSFHAEARPGALP